MPEQYDISLEITGIIRQVYKKGTVFIQATSIISSKGSPESNHCRKNPRLLYIIMFFLYIYIQIIKIKFHPCF